MRKGTGTLVLGLVVGLSVALLADRHATSEPAPGGDADADDATGQGFNPFVLSDPGPGVIPFDELSPEEQGEVNAMAEATETNSGGDVQMALANATAQEATRARAEIAARNIGMEGADQEGVVP